MKKVLIANSRGNSEECPCLVLAELGSAGGIEAPAPVSVHVDEGAAFLHHHLGLPIDILVLAARVLADEHEVVARHVGLLTAAALDVCFVVGVQFLLKLAVVEAEVDVLIRLPRGHEAIAMQVRAAEADEGSGEAHARMMRRKVIVKMGSSGKRWKIPRRQEVNLAIIGATDDASATGR